jgi:hypothetical protein
MNPLLQKTATQKSQNKLKKMSTSNKDRYFTTVEGDDTHLFWGCSNPISHQRQHSEPCDGKIHGRHGVTARCTIVHADCHTANDLLDSECRKCGVKRARGDVAVTQKGDMIGLYTDNDSVMYFKTHYTRADHFYWECKKEIERAGPGVKCEWRGPIYYPFCRQCGELRAGGDLAVDYEGGVIGVYEGIKSVCYTKDPDPGVLLRWIYRVSPSGSSDVESGKETIAE